MRQLFVLQRCCHVIWKWQVMNSFSYTCAIRYENGVLIVHRKLVGRGGGVKIVTAHVFVKANRPRPVRPLTPGVRSVTYETMDFECRIVSWRLSQQSVHMEQRDYSLKPSLSGLFVTVLNTWGFYWNFWRRCSLGYNRTNNTLRGKWRSTPIYDI